MRTTRKLDIRNIQYLYECNRVGIEYSINTDISDLLFRGKKEEECKNVLFFREIRVYKLRGCWDVACSGYPVRFSTSSPFF